jgi:hypothetical protein
MATQSPPYDPPATLPAHRAFVVHFAATSRRRRRFFGRVEHLATGAAAQFRSLRDLLEFFAERVDAPRGRP